MLTLRERVPLTGGTTSPSSHSLPLEIKECTQRMSLDYKHHEMLEAHSLKLK